jgi:polyisoprenyl-teichoic acid--peptidoglycan teichoic acid transferase
MNERREQMPDKEDEQPRLRLPQQAKQTQPPPLTPPDYNMARPVSSQGNRPQPQPQNTPAEKQRLSLEEWQRKQQSAPSPMTRTQKARQRRSSSDLPRARRRSRPYAMSCLLLAILFIGGALALYIFAPSNTNILVLGLDRSIDEGGWLSRSDTIILANLHITRANVNMVSIPRDLWVNIPLYGENRINTAHYFAEVNIPGSGPQSAINTVESNFGVPVDHYVRIKLEEFPLLVDAMGGVPVTLTEPMGGLPAGTHMLNGEEALKFVRDRSGTDDFFRMRQAQFFVQMVINRMKQPVAWLRLPRIMAAAQEIVDTDIPVWTWGRYGIALLRAYPDKVNSQILTREMVTPYVTESGANILLPNWAAILPLMQEQFYRPNIIESLLGTTP